MTERAAVAKERLRASSRDFGKDIVAMSLRIHSHPELGNEERRAVAWCRETLERHGFTFEIVPGIETAFVATRAGRGPGPTIGFLAEYDALPGVDHGCGHNLIAGSAVGAGVFLADLMDGLPGTIRVYGCPAEELGTGKPMMLGAGAFAGLDVALTFHPFSATAIMESCTGVRLYEFEFRGKPAHAAADPWRGASALDGVLLTYMNLNALRQFTPDGMRIHGIVTDGGQAVNIIPERAVCKLGVRSSDPEELARVCARVIECARAGALASGTALEIRETALLDPVKCNRTLAALMTDNLSAMGETVGSWRAPASTDFGNISQTVPSLLFSVATWPDDVAFHTREAATAAGAEQGLKAMLTAAEAMARTAIDLLLDDDALGRTREDFAR